MQYAHFVSCLNKRGLSFEHRVIDAAIDLRQLAVNYIHVSAITIEKVTILLTPAQVL